MRKLGFIGTGNLGSMLVRGFIGRSAVRACDIHVLSRTPGKAEKLREEFPGLSVHTSYQEIIKAADLIFICVKPPDLPAVLEGTGREFAEEKIIVSALLVPHLSDLEQIIRGKLVRIYPSVTQSTGKGAMLLTWGRNIGGAEKEALLPLFGTLGKVYELPEELYRAAGDVTSCGPAFMAAMVGSLAQEAVRHGIQPAAAAEMALETMHGTALLMERNKLGFAELIAKVATPGGCTASGLQILEQKLPPIAEEIYRATCSKENEIAANLRKVLPSNDLSK